MNTTTSELVVSRSVYKHDGNGEGRPYRYTNRELAQFVTSRTPERMSDLVGRRMVFDAGSPGTGRVVYNVTRIDNDGIWATMIENTVRELTAADVY